MCGMETSPVVLLRGRAAVFHTYRSRARPLFDRHRSIFHTMSSRLNLEHTHNLENGVDDS